MVSINWSKEAEFWLKDIYNYIALNDKIIAKKVIDEIVQKVQSLKDFPQIGYVYPNDDALEIRILLYGHYRIVYLVKNVNAIDILGIFHGALAIEKYF